MAKLDRKLQKQFAGLLVASNNIAAFGSLKAGSPSYSKDLDAIQTTAFENGLAAATVNNNAPALQDLNALFYLTTTQLAYLLQAGVPEWNSATTYYVGSLVNDGYGNVFKSVVDSNTSLLTVKASWRIANQGQPWSSSVTYHTGDVVTSTDGTTLYYSLVDSNTSALTVKASWRIANQGQPWSSSVTYHTGDVVCSVDGKTQYACLADSTTAALTDATKWRPIAQNGTVPASGPTATLNCQDGCVFDAAAGAGGNKTFTITKMHDGQTINVNVYGVAGNTIAWTLTGAKADDGLGLTEKKGITYSNTMTSGQSLYTLTRIGSVCVINSLHGIT